MAKWSEAETFWTEFLRKLARRGLRGVKLVISDARDELRDWARAREYWDRAIRYLKLARTASDPDVRSRFVAIARH